MYVHVRLLSADALKLWVRLRRRYTFVSQPTDHPRTSLSLGKVDAPSTKLSFKMEGASFLHFLNTPLWQSPLTLAPAGSLSRDFIEEAQRELFVSPACCPLRSTDSLSRC